MEEMDFKPLFYYLDICFGLRGANALELYFFTDN